MSVAIDSHAAHADSGKPLEYSHHDDSLKIFGFWIFLFTDMLLFGCLFATYLVLHGNSNGGPTTHTFFEIPTFVAETFILLTSSFTGGLATYEMRRGNKGRLIGWLIVTMLLGMAFVGLEINEFSRAVLDGHTLATSGFLSGFFTLVGTHGCHVSLGIIWMICIIIQLSKMGITPQTARKVFVIGLYWHFLDVVWVFIFTAVYLMGVM